METPTFDASPLPLFTRESLLKAQILITENFKRSKEARRTAAFYELYEKIHGFKYSRHRSKRIIKKLKKRHQPTVKMWFGESEAIQRCMKELDMYKAFEFDRQLSFADHRVDAMQYAFTATAGLTFKPLRAIDLMKVTSNA